jgi:class 3 adenylate cyclase
VGDFSEREETLRGSRGSAVRWMGLDDGLDLAQRSNLIELDRELHRLWGLGKNFVLGWSRAERAILLLVVPHYRIADYAVGRNSEAPLPAGQTHENHEFLARLLSGSRRYTVRQLERAARLLNAEPTRLPLRQALTDNPIETQIVDDLVRRYGVSYASGRAVALFDIVGFSLLSPFEQMTQLNSLSYSLNSAHSKMLEGGMPIDFARSSTGDGFYIWNRSTGRDANLHLYHFMHLVLADNAIARRKAHARTVPMLRAGFHVGSCYEFYHAEGLNPTLYTDIVGQVTIELARMIENAMPGQILVGEFLADPQYADSPTPGIASFDSVAFVDRAQLELSQLNGLELSGDAIESIKCYLTGRACADGSFTIRKLAIHDKHGLTRNAFNAKVNIYRRAAEPILLGIEDRLLRGEGLTVRTVGHLSQPVG